MNHAFMHAMFMPLTMKMPLILPAAPSFSPLLSFSRVPCAFPPRPPPLLLYVPALFPLLTVRPCQATKLCYEAAQLGMGTSPS